MIFLISVSVYVKSGEANFLGGVARLYKVETFDPVKAKARFFEIYIEKVNL